MFIRDIFYHRHLVTKLPNALTTQIQLYFRQSIAYYRTVFHLGAIITL